MILDTNAFSAWADGKETLRVPLKSARRLIVPSIVLGEYMFGVFQSRYRARYENWLAANLPSVEVALVGTATAREYAQIRVELKKAATSIPANDAWIAALARQHAMPVLSNDVHFDVVPGLKRVAF